MRARDVIGYGWSSLAGYRGRTALVLLAMSISVASVVLLTALGEGAKRYVLGEFQSLGTHMLVVLPGKSETAGGAIGNVMGITPRELTLEDARALKRNPAVVSVAPINVGEVEASWRGRSRSVGLLGTVRELNDIRHWKIARGQFLPQQDWDRSSPVCVIGDTVRRDLFGRHLALGQWLRVAQTRCRVIGLLARKGKTIDVNLDEEIIVPVALAQSLLNVSSLFRIIVGVRSQEEMDEVRQFIIDTIRKRHHGEEDITVITQDAVLKSFDNILSALTYGISGIAAISLVVAGILIMNVMLVVVAQRRPEIGLLKALGASRRQILLLILAEATLLSLMGAALGLLVGLIGSWAIHASFPDLQTTPPLWAVLAAIGVALITGLLFSLMPARQAARLDPVLALQQGHG